VDQVVEHLPRKCEAPSSNPSAAKNNKKSVGVFVGERQHHSKESKSTGNSQCFSAPSETVRADTRNRAAL
jgi:hypothetical protein